MTDLITQKLLDTLQNKIFPVPVSDGLEVRVEDLKAEPYYPSPEDVKEAVLAKKSLTFPIKGRLVLVDKTTGKVLDRTGVKTLVEVPAISPHLSTIIDGTEYTIFNQIRQRPGIYTRIRETGETETRFNTAKGDSFSIVSDPKTGEVYVQTKNHGKIPIVSFLQAMGLDDAEISKLLGPKLAVKNFDKAAKYKNFSKLGDFVDMVKNVAEVDPETTKITLGKEYKKLTTNTIVDALKKNLAVAAGEEEPDHMANLAFKSFHTPEMLLAEALEKKSRPQIQKLVARIKQKKQIPRTWDLKSPILTFLTTSSLSSNPEQNNPMEIFETALKVTYMGEGGIKSTHAILDEFRDVHPTYAGFIDLIRTSESQKAGVDLRLANGTAVDDQGNIYQAFRNLKTGEVEYISPKDLWDKKVKLSPNDDVAIHRGKVVPAKDADYLLLSPTRLFGPTTVLVPFLNSDHGNRAQMAAKMFTQAVPLVHRETPLVEVVDPETGISLPDFYAKLLNPIAEDEGVVTKVTDKEITVKYKDGSEQTYKLYHNYPLSRKTFLHQTPTVKEGQKVKPGQLLAESNFTKDGKLALGTNLRVAYMPYHGLNHEDGIVISESAAKKLTSEHSYKFDLELDKNKHKADKELFAAQFPTEFTKEQLGKLDANGVVKPGTVLKPGDPIFAFVKKAEPTPEDVVLGRLSKDLLRKYQPEVEVWNKDVEGVVQDVYFDGKKVKVVVKTKEPAKEGDKLTLVHGAKGVITKILPDDKMPRDKDGRPVDMIVTPVAVLARINPGQIYELAAGKVAEKTGKPVQIPAYGTENNYEFVKKLLEKHGLSAEEELYDPVDGRKKKVLTGPMYVLKLNKLTDFNFSARGPEGEYDVDLRPLKGGEEGSKAIGSMEFYALVSHNVPNLLQEMATFKATKAADFWQAVYLGKKLPEPRPTFATQKFFAMLKGAGVNVKRRNGEVSLLPLTDKDVLAISNGEIRNAKKLKYNLDPEPGGLFDPVLTGGLAGTKWTHITLEHPIVNPLFEEMVEWFVPGWKNLPPSELEQKLKELKVDELYAKEKDPQKRRVLRSLKEHGFQTLADAYLLKHIPVLPPKFRPVIPRGPKDLLVHDANFLYTDVILTNDAIRKLKEEGLPEEAYHEEYQNLYRHVKALFGLAEPTAPYAKKRGIKGLLAIALGQGKAPKESYFQSKVVKKLQAPAGRGTLVTDPHLGIDEVGLPEDMAWKLYAPHVIQELTHRGYPLWQAKEMVEKQDPIARQVLEQKLKEVPVIINRAPSLWKYNLVALYPKIHHGKSIAINMLIAKGLAGDLDGDTVNVHIPITPQAVEDAKKMLPSKIAIEPRTRAGLLYKPSQEADLGIKLGLKPREDQQPVRISSVEELREKLKKGEIDWRTPVELATAQGT